jgi:apolipoprotein D and lipocalin family protein
MNMRTVVLLPAFALGATGTLRAQTDEKPRPVESVDLERYAGLWYEIARIPNQFQKDCAGAATATYELRDDGRIDVINRCTKDDGKVKEARGVARLDDEGGARLEVSFFSIFGWRPVWADYWILALGEDYEYSVVGEGSRKYGWILGRNPTLDESQLEALFQTLRDQGYDPAEFEVFDSAAAASAEAGSQGLP